MSDTLDSLHREFIAYRQLQRRGAYPRELRRRAVSALAPAQLLQLAARLGLTAAQVARWDHGRMLQQDEASSFFEVTPPPTPSAYPATGARGVVVEVETRSGATLRLHGEMEPRLLTVLVQVLQQRADA